MTFRRMLISVFACLALAALCACGDAPKDESKADEPTKEEKTATAQPAPEAPAGSSASDMAAGKDVKSVTLEGQTFHYVADPCALLSKDAAGEIFGEASGEAKFTFIPGIPPQAACVYATIVPEAERFDRSPSILRIAVIDPVIVKEAAYTDDDTVQKAFERHKAALGKTKDGVIELPELGIPAFAQPQAGTAYFLKGDLFVRVTAKISKKDQAENMDAMKAMQAKRNLGAAVAAANSILPNID